MHRTAKIAGFVAAMILAYGLGYYQQGRKDTSEPTELRITVDGSEDGMKLKPLAKGDQLSVDAMEVTVRNDTPPDPQSQFPHQYGAQCPLKDRDPARVVGRSGDTVLLEVMDRTPDGLFTAGDRIVRQDMEAGVSRTVFYCPVGTLFTLDRRHVDIERIRHLSETASRQRQQEIDTGERTTIHEMLRQNGGH